MRTTLAILVTLSLPVAGLADIRSRSVEIPLEIPDEESPDRPWQLTLAGLATDAVFLLGFLALPWLRRSLRP